MKKVLLSVLTILAVSAATFGATQALFSDEETSTGNTFTAGTLDLKTNNADGTTASYTLANIKPGDWNLAGQVVLKNAGSVNGTVSYEITNVRNLENDCLEMEDGDASCGVGDDQGELGGLAKASLQANVAPWTRFPTSPVSINAAEGVRYEIGTLNAGETLPIVTYGVWTPTANDNIAQGDSVIFDVVFYLEQN
ncbi:MAG TPA: TasA family protein [Candidatus Levybacteria bacterium]|nr:TasA family protein [Candidatus Levybacteria bacterium]